MSPQLLLRLTLDFIAASLLLIGLAYWWLGNTVHELAGTGMFLLIITHNLFNRRWYGSLSHTRRETRGLVNIAVTVMLATAMLALLVTSLMISRTLANSMPDFAGFTARQVHILAAYWALIIVAIHLGLRWPMIMHVARTQCGISGASVVRSLVLRLVAVAIALHGVWSSFELGVGSQLSMQVSLDWWNFEETVIGFFVHSVAIAGLYIFLTYYAMSWLQRRTTRRGPAPTPVRVAANADPR